LPDGQGTPNEPVALGLGGVSRVPFEVDPRAEPSPPSSAVMQPEVLIEPAEHDLQMTLLVAPSPVHVLNQPLVGAGEELPTALHAGESNQGKPSAAISSTNMFKAQKLEGLQTPTVVRATLRGL